MDVITGVGFGGDIQLECSSPEDCPSEKLFQKNCGCLRSRQKNSHLAPKIAHSTVLSRSVSFLVNNTYWGAVAAFSSCVLPPIFAYFSAPGRVVQGQNS